MVLLQHDEGKVVAADAAAGEEGRMMNCSDLLLEAVVEHDVNVDGRKVEVGHAECTLRDALWMMADTVIQVVVAVQNDNDEGVVAVAADLDDDDDEGEEDTLTLGICLMYSTCKVVVEEVDHHRWCHCCCVEIAVGHCHDHDHEKKKEEGLVVPLF